MRCTLAGLLVALSLLSGACISPPDKEMNQARGAIEAARAAGADVYAKDDYQAAVASLKKSEDAVAQRDYRQALNFALESREQAENAARNAADGKAAARSQAEREMHDVQTVLEQARQRLEAAETTKARRRALLPQRRAIDAADASVQKARTALGREDYAGALDDMRAVPDALRATMREIEQAIQPAPARRRR